MPNLQKLKDEESCPKCGEAKTEAGPARLAKNYVATDNEIELSCLACGHAWRRLPKDAQD